MQDFKVFVALGSGFSNLGNFLYKLSKLSVFSETEQKESSTFREMTALADFYCSEIKGYISFKNTDVLHCEKMLQVVYKKSKLHPLVFSFFAECRALNIRLKVQYISRSDPGIQIADAGSRHFDLADFSMDFDNFILIS